MFISFRASKRFKYFFGKSKVIDVYEDHIDDLEIDFENRSPLDCPKISFLEIEIGEIKDDYKLYLENYLTYSGNKKQTYLQIFQIIFHMN